MIMDDAVLLGIWLTLISVGAVAALSFQAHRLRKRTDVILQQIAGELKRREAGGQ